MNTRLYQERVQIDGTAAHRTIDEKRYSTRKEILQGLDVYSTKHGLCGKIDIFNSKSGLLTERKKRIKAVYDGYIFQLYGQYYALTDMGYVVHHLRLYSIENNKVYPVPLPYEKWGKEQEFLDLLQRIRQFSLDAHFTANSNKCRACIYNP